MDPDWLGLGWCSCSGGIHGRSDPLLPTTSSQSKHEHAGVA